MQPTNEEIDAAIEEEAAAMKQFSKANKSQTNATLKVMAARKRLMDARGAKNALMQDMMSYSK